ncbi:MAG: ABC transporter permease [Acidobacteriaceae bacterium]
MTPETNTLSSALPNDAAQTAAPSRSINELQRLFWSIRREFWENRSIYIAPLAVAALIVLAFLYAAIRTPIVNVQVQTPTGDMVMHRMPPIVPYEIAATLIMGTTFLVAVFYCLDALYSERRDRSILFWKSLPLSDLTTVLSKTIIPIVILPAIAFVVVIVTQSLMLLISVLTLHARGLSGTTHLPLLKTALVLLYHLITMQALWYAPIYGWLLLVSAWARRAPLLWAVLPPVALGVLEGIALHSNHIFEILRYRISGPQDTAFTGSHMSITLAQINPAHFLATPGLWTGLVLALVFIAAAIQLRHYRNPI